MSNYFSAIILMGGIGARMGSSVPKQFRTLGKMKIYQHTLKTFKDSGLFHEIILVCHPEWVQNVKEEGIKLIAGGKTRQESSWLGLQACEKACQYVMIHDAVRPFVSVDILRKNAEAVIKYNAVDTVIPSADTLLMTEDGKTIAEIPSRSKYRRGQTPQTFSYPLICKAHEMASSNNATDDCQLILGLGEKVHLVEGAEENMKITSEWDLSVAEHYLQTISNI